MCSHKGMFQLRSADPRGAKPTHAALPGLLVLSPAEWDGEAKQALKNRGWCRAGRRSAREEARRQESKLPTARCAVQASHPVCTRHLGCCQLRSEIPSAQARAPVQQESDSLEGFGQLRLLQPATCPLWRAGASPSTNNTKKKKKARKNKKKEARQRDFCFPGPTPCLLVALGQGSSTARVYALHTPLGQCRRSTSCKAECPGCRVLLAGLSSPACPQGTPPQGNDPPNTNQAPAELYLAPEPHIAARGACSPIQRDHPLLAGQASVPRTRRHVPKASRHHSNQTWKTHMTPVSVSLFFFVFFFYEVGTGQGSEGAWPEAALHGAGCWRHLADPGPCTPVAAFFWERC